MQHVPYRGNGPALTDLLGGQIQIMFDTMPQAIGYVRAGKLRALAVTTATRSEVLPDVPTVGETVPGYEASSLYGIAAPRNTPAEIVDKLNREINAALADPAMKTRLADLGRHGACRLARRLCKAHRRRNREVGQGGQALGRQAGLTLSDTLTGQFSHSQRPRPMIQALSSSPSQASSSVNRVIICR